MAYLRLVINPSDEEAFKRVVNYKKRGIGDTTIGRLTEYQRKENIDIFTAAKNAPLSGRARTQLNKFLHIIESGIQKNEDEKAYEQADDIDNDSEIID